MPWIGPIERESDRDDLAFYALSSDDEIGSFDPGSLL